MITFIRRDNNKHYAQTIFTYIEGYRDKNIIVKDLVGKIPYTISLYEANHISKSDLDNRFKSIQKLRDSINESINNIALEYLISSGLINLQDLQQALDNNINPFALNTAFQLDLNEDRILGVSDLNALSILIDAIHQKQDTLPHEYAHHYINWFRNSDLVQEGINRFGSEEKLVQAIGEQVVKQKGRAYHWWQRFTNYILNLFNRDQRLLNSLTHSFLTRANLTLQKSINGDENKGYTQEMEDILEKAPRDEQGRLLAPNGKVSNLTERQYAHVRTKAFKEWFGDWERVAKSRLGNNIGNIDISEIINEDNSINFDKLEEITDKYFKTADISLFKQNRETLKERKEHHDGETNTLEHLKNVVKSASELNIREDLKPILVLAAALHDISKPFHGGQIHGYQSVDIINKLFKGNINNLVKFAIRHHMLTLDESKSFTQEDANRIIQDAKDNNLNINDAIDVLLALNTADIIRGRNLSAIDKYTNKSLIDTINSEIPQKRLLLENAVTNDVSKVVDENGEPLVVYHRTPNKFNIFDVNKIGSTTDSGQYGKGFYFGIEKDRAEGDNLMEVFLNIRNPFNITKDSRISNIAYVYNRPFNEWNDWHKKHISKKEANLVNSKDGIIDLVNDNEFVVSSPNQIKSATDNIGTYSKDNDDIRYQKEDNNVNQDGTIKSLESMRITPKIIDYNSLDIRTKLELEQQGFTEEEFNRLSEKEKDAIIECAAF